MKILYMQDNSNLAIINLTESNTPVEELASTLVPEGNPFVIADDSVIPADTSLRDAWEVSKKALTNNYNPKVVIKVNTVKAEKIKRARLPNLSPVDFELCLLKAGIRQQVLDYVATSDELQIVFSRSGSFARTSPFVLQVMSALNLTDAQVDTMWSGATK
jgi:hypothetical protein